MSDLLAGQKQKLTSVTSVPYFECSGVQPHPENTGYLDNCWLNTVTRCWRRQSPDPWRQRQLQIVAQAAI
ncbi:unnamed protein product [Caretta caretta]